MLTGGICFAKHGIAGSAEYISAKAAGNAIFWTSVTCHSLSSRNQKSKDEEIITSEVIFYKTSFVELGYNLFGYMEKHALALAYYRFVPLEDPQAEVARHKSFFSGRACAGRIYISEEGINGQMSASLEESEAYMAWLRSDPRFADIQFNTHPVQESIFPRITVKYRKQLVALDQKIDPNAGGIHVSPAEWKKMLESGRYLVLDVRNRYEWEIGHFERAVLPPLETFREFPAYAEEMKNTCDPATTPVMMYCTGGIRCELYSALMKKKGFKDVYQLKGGVIRYGLEEGSTHWQGKLFVFDDRLAVSIDGKLSDPIAECHHCHLPCDIYYNCANMDCNELFICCPSCLTIYRGCCSQDCTTMPRLRALDARAGNKPFKRKSVCALSAQESSLESGKSSPLIQA
jgi:UPF0176 protein